MSGPMGNKEKPSPAIRKSTSAWLVPSWGGPGRGSRGCVFKDESIEMVASG